MDNKITQKRQVFDILYLYSPLGVTNSNLNKICLRYGARIYQLRNKPHNLDIECFSIRHSESDKEKANRGLRYYRLNTPTREIDIERMAVR